MLMNDSLKHLELFKLKHSDIELFVDSRQVFVNNLELPLTGLEFNLLSLLLLNAPKVVAHHEIAQQIFQQKHNQCCAAISTHISHLRKKLCQYQSKVSVKPVRGQGYYLVALK